MKFVDCFMAHCELLSLQAAGLVEPCDFVEVEAFAEKLCGLEGLDYDDLLERLADVEIPGDFRHLRLTNMNTDSDWGGRYDSLQRPLKLADILLVISCSMEDNHATPYGRVGVWTRTVALPIQNEGTLELGVYFKRPD